MVEFNKILFLLFASLMIFPAHALDVIFSMADENIKQQSEISTFIENGRKKYCGTLNLVSYRPKLDTTKVIVYIIDKSRYVEIVRNAVRGIRLQIAQQLSEWHYELVFLGIDNFDDDEYHLISAFLLHKIQSSRRNQPNLTIETIGEDHFDRVYPCDGTNFAGYQENGHICGGTLRARLRDIPSGAIRPIESNGKYIGLYGFVPFGKEVKWSVIMENNTYTPNVNVSKREYNFRIRFKTKKICLLILRGKEYSAVTNRGARQMPNLQTILSRMTMDDEGLFILGVFNFDWTEIYIVTQVILQHSIGWHRSGYNVFTYGHGMFNSFYLNENISDGRNLLPQVKSNVTELIEELMGGEVKERFINMYYSGYGWKIPIILHNGRYVAEANYDNFTFPWVNQRIAFIVFNSTEKNNAIDIPMVNRSIVELRQSGIYVVLIEAFHFGLDDVHIIAQWIDRHRMRAPDTKPIINSEQIVVLGGGIFDTIFQSESTTYRTFFDTKNDKLKAIRNAHVYCGNRKRILVADVHNSMFEVWTYPVNTVNGYYEPDLIPDKNRFDTTGGKMILFIIISGNRFHQVLTISSVDMTPIGQLRQSLGLNFPRSHWSIFLVGLENFEERDQHLFAEFVKTQTHDQRSCEKFVCAFNYDLGPPVYQYKDDPLFLTDDRLRTEWSIASFFRMICTLSGDTPSQA